MEQSFSLNRVYLLLKAIFITETKTNKIMYIILLSLPIIMYIANLSPNIHSQDLINLGAEFTIYMSILFSMITSLAICQNYSNKLLKNTLYMLPASINEIFFVMFILPFLAMIFISIFNIINVSLWWSITSFNGNKISYIDTISTVCSSVFSYDNPYLNWCIILLIVHPIGLLTRILFKNKFIISLIPVSIVILLYLKGYEYQFSSLDIATIIIISIIFWVISYFKFRKIQLNE